MQGSNEEAKSNEILKLQKMLESLSLELDAAKLAAINECNKNAVLQNQMELLAKEKYAFERETVATVELKKENAFLKVSCAIDLSGNMISLVFRYVLSSVMILGNTIFWYYHQPQTRLDS